MVDDEVEDMIDEHEALLRYRICDCEDYYPTHPYDCPHEIAKRMKADLEAAEGREEDLEDERNDAETPYDTGPCWYGSDNSPISELLLPHLPAGLDRRDDLAAL